MELSAIVRKEGRKGLKSREGWKEGRKEGMTGKNYDDPNGPRPTGKKRLFPFFVRRPLRRACSVGCDLVRRKSSIKSD